MEVREGPATGDRRPGDRRPGRLMTGKQSLQYLMAAMTMAVVCAGSAPVRDYFGGLGEGTSGCPVGMCDSGASERAISAAWSSRMSLVFSTSRRTRQDPGATGMVGPED